jgi:hypothetical protein
MRYCLLAIALLCAGVCAGQEPAELRDIEYFFDKDPGYGRGLKVASPPSPEINIDFIADVSSLANGIHTLYVRIKDEHGDWSLTHSRPFVKFPGASNQPKISGLEYFFDRDPGYGNGVSVNTDDANELSTIFTADVSSLGAGPHVLYTRVRDAAGKWSLTNAHAFVKTADKGGIVRFEYFFDTDPGYGKAKQLTVEPGQGAYTFDVDLAGLAMGVHTLYVRGQDADGKWGHTAAEQVVISRSTRPTEPAGSN